MSALQCLFQCRDLPMTSEAFLTILRSTDNLDELTATKEMVERETAQLVSIHDSA